MKTKVKLKELLAEAAFERYNRDKPHLPWEMVGDDHRFVWRGIVEELTCEAKRFFAKRKEARQHPRLHDSATTGKTEQ